MQAVHRLQKHRKINFVMTERRRRIKRIKLEPAVEDRYEKVDQIKQECNVKDEPVDFEFERTDCEAVSHNEDPDVEDECETVRCREPKKQKTTVSDEPVNFKFERTGFETDSHSEDSVDTILHRQSAEEELSPNDFEADSHNEDSVEAILHRKRAEEELSPVTIENLRNLRVKLRHEVPPQHQVEKMAGSHVPTAAEKKAFEKLAPKQRIKKGTFTPEEDQLIVDNWKAFCEIHHWDKMNPKPFLYMRQYNGTFYLKRETDRKKFVQFLADGLPSRTLYSVYHRFRLLYDSPRLRARYSYQEDEYIINHIERNPKLDQRRMFADLAKALNRSRASVWRRYRLLQKNRRQAESDED